MIFFFLRAIVICMPAVVAEEAHPQTPALICDFAGGFISKQDLSLRIQIVRVSHLQLVNRDPGFWCEADRWDRYDFSREFGGNQI